MTQLKALIFDVDGTLAETEKNGHRIAFNRAFKEAGLQWEWDENLYGKLLKVAGGKERIKYYLQQYLEEFSLPQPLGEFISKLHALKTKHYKEILANDTIPLRLGIKRLLEEAKNHKIRLAIATTAALPNAIALLEYSLAKDAPSWFEIIAAGDIVVNKKPAPDIYQYLLEKMNLSPRECLVFEDTNHGLIAATKANLKTVVTVNNYTKDQDFSQAVLVVNHLGENHQPFTVIKGDGKGKNYFDLELAKELLNS